MTTANTEAPAAPPRHFWPVVAVALIWNAYGVYDYLMSRLQGDAYLRGHGATAAQLAYFHAMPVWMGLVWAIGVWGGLFGAVLLLIRSRHAWKLFAASLAAFLVSVVYAFGLSGAGAAMGGKAVAMDAVIAAAGVAFIWYSRAMAKAGVLR